jgi:hypothetical protein
LLQLHCFSKLLQLKITRRSRWRYYLAKFAK